MSVEDFHHLRGDLRRPDFQRRHTLQIGGNRTQNGREVAPAKAGVVAFSTAGDAELGDYDDEPTIIFKTEQLPVHFEDT